MKNTTRLLGLLVALFISTSMYAQDVPLSTSIPEEGKPKMIVVSANYGLLFGYSFFIEHRGAKRSGNKEIYKTFENELINMGNPSDATLFMENSGYELMQVYSFPKGDDITTINYVYRKRD